LHAVLCSITAFKVKSLSILPFCFLFATSIRYYLHACRTLNEVLLSESETPTPRAKSTEESSNIGQAVMRLRELILKGNFQAGERISELPLVALLGVSRTPIRLALERLAHEGLLEPYPTGGFIVRAFTVDDLWDAIDVRGALEGTAARLAAERFVDASELDALRKIQDEMDGFAGPTVDLTRYYELNEAFHAEIVRLSKSPMIRLMLDRLFCLPFASPSAIVGSPHHFSDADIKFRTGQEHHHLLIQAISNRRGSFAESLAREHANLTRTLLAAAREDTDALAQIPGAPLITFNTVELSTVKRK
jgi:GntR family transcriptional regulator of vanillate catabolism